MHPPQHLSQTPQQQQHHHEEGPSSPVSSDRPVIHRSATQQRYAKSRFLMRLPRRHVVQRTSAAARDAGEDGDHHYASTADDYDFVDSLLEADEDTAFIDNLIGASNRKKQEDLNGHQNGGTHLEMVMAKQPLRRIRLVGRRVMYSLGTFIFFYSFLSFWQSRKSKFSWRAYKENLHQNFAAFPESQQQQHALRGGSGGGGMHHRNSNNLDYNNNPQQQGRMMYDSSLSNPQRSQHQALSPLSQNNNNNNNNLQQQALWVNNGRDDLAVSRQDPLARLSPQQQGRFVAPFNGYANNNNNNMIQQQQQQPLAGYGLGNQPLLRGIDGFPMTSAWMDNTNHQKGSLSMGMSDGMESANMLHRQQHQPQQQQQQPRNTGESSLGGDKSRKGWRLLRKKQKPQATSSSSSIGATGNNNFDDGGMGSAAVAAAAAVKASSSLSNSGSLLMDPTAGGNNNFIMGNAMTDQLRRPYTHGYD